MLAAHMCRFEDDYLLLSSSLRLTHILRLGVLAVLSFKTLIDNKFKLWIDHQTLVEQTAVREYCAQYPEASGENHESRFLS